MSDYTDCTEWLALQAKRAAQMEQDIRAAVRLAHEYDALLFMSATSATEVVRRLLVELRNAKSQATQARAQAAMVTAERDTYKLASETAIYEASQFDRGLFLSGDRGVEDVMRRVLEALKVARSEATQAKAQAAFVAAERDQLRQEKEQWRVLKVAAYVDGLGANLGILYEEFQKTLNYFIEANKRKRAAQNDARELAQALNKLCSLPFNFALLNDADDVVQKYGAKYLEPKP